MADSENSKKTKKKRTKVKKPKVSEPVPDIDITGLDDDFKTDLDRVVFDPRLAVQDVVSQSDKKVYIEKGSRFQSVPVTDLLNAGSRIHISQPEKQTTLDIGIASHKIFQGFALLFYGSFAGFALCQSILVYILSKEEYGFTDFLIHYRFFAWPVQCIYYFLFTWCLVSVLDRVDISRITGTFPSIWRRTVTFQTSGLAAFFYLIGLIMSLCLARMDDRIQLTKENSELHGPDEISQDLSQWRTVNLIRSLCAVLGWIVIVISSNKDALRDNLVNSGENILVLNDNTMQETTGRHNLMTPANRTAPI